MTPINTSRINGLQRDFNELEAKFETEIETLKTEDTDLRQTNSLLETENS